MLHIPKLVLVVSLNLFLVYAADNTTTETTNQVATNKFNIPTCNEKDENINECLLKIFQDMMPRTKYGIPELNIPPSDPLVVNRTTLVFSHPLFEGRLSLRNIKIYGFSDVKVNKIQYKREGNKVHIKDESYLDKLFLKGEFKAKMRLNTANISSRGPFNVTLSNVSVNHDIYADLYQKDDGHTYIRLKTFNFNPTVGNMLFHAEGIMQDPLLNNAVLEFINQNWRSLYKTILPETRSVWEPEIIRVGNTYFELIPLDAVLKL